MSNSVKDNGNIHLTKRYKNMLPMSWH